MASARQLSGTVLGTDLNSIAGVDGLIVTNTDGVASPQPLSATAVTAMPDAFVSKLPVTALGNELLTAGLTLGAPVDGLGAYTQWAQAQDSGHARAAAGLVTDQSGAVQVGPSATERREGPSAAKITLGEILPASLAGVTLDVGAVASSASVQGCEMVNGWPTLAADPLDERDYGIASLDLNAAIPAVGALSAGASGAVRDVPAQVNALLGTGGLTTGISSGIAALINPVLGGLELGSVSTVATMSAPDLTGVSMLMTESLTDGVVTINLGAAPGQPAVRVNVASLTGSITGLNGMGPNHPVVLDSAVVTALNDRITSLLNAWKTRVVEKLSAALRSVTLSATTNISLKLLGANVASISVKAGPSSLGQYLDGKAVAPSVTPEVLGLDLGGTVAGLLAPITSALRTDTNQVVKSVVEATIFNTGLIPAVSANIQQLSTPAVNAVGSVLTAVGALVSIHVNVQPDKPWLGERPKDVSANPGEYKVSAIRVGLIYEPELLSLSLGTSAAGPVNYRPS
ncbi:choice-of-anchor G family protein [Pseudarthrobacter chlorophenolicus]|uniref:choice-of-anchor G family protein n=1 Tax=Pseudarthrobacter chlorophenolicus TaxID=85085 RepID=UPI001FCB1922|nr:choice-of-anchor G family protein [Pseudarthrobacter chlorophenolicus]